MADGKKPIKVQSYSNVAFAGAWKGRGRALWSTAVIGLAFGAAVGAIAPFFPVLAGAQTLAGAASLMAQTVAVFSAFGMASGFVIGAAAGAPAGAIADVTKEQERRDREREEALGIAKPELAPEMVEDTRTRWQKVKDTVTTYVNPKVGTLFATLGAAGGAIMAHGFLAAGGEAATAVVPGMDIALGTLANPATPGYASAVTSYFIGCMAAFGGLWCFNFPKITADMQEFTGRLQSGELLGTSWGPEPARAPEIEQHRASKIAHTLCEPLTQHADANFVYESTRFRDKLAAEAVPQNIASNQIRM